MASAQTATIDLSFNLDPESTPDTEGSAMTSSKERNFVASVAPAVTGIVLVALAVIVPGKAAYMPYFTVAAIAYMLWMIILIRRA